MDTRQPTTSPLLDHRTLSEPLLNLGFDPATDWSISVGATGPVSVWMHRQELDLADHRSFFLEYRLIVAPADRDGDTVCPGKESAGIPRIIAVQIAGIHTLNPGKDSFQVIFEKTYAIGTLTAPEKSRMISDMIRMVERYNRQLQNFCDLFQPAMTSK